VPPRWRLPLLVLGFVCLVSGVAGGLARLSPVPAPGAAIALHGPLMVSGFFGTLIALERAAALDRLWAYGGPLCAGLGGVVLILGFATPGFILLIAGSAFFALANGLVVARHRTLEMATLAAGAAAWLVGNAALLAGYPAVPWWMAFFALTVAAERLELSRYARRGPAVRAAFMVLAAALLFSPLEPRMMGLVLVALALWLFAFDLARITVRQRALPRYVALCLLAGYFWLAAGGALITAQIAYDAALHAIFVGFVFSMVFGHAPVILPAVLRVRFPYSPLLYAPLALLHLSLAVRVTVSTTLGAWGNAAAIALFILTAIYLVARVDRGQRARAASR
jgi:hypothetical protein